MVRYDTQKLKNQKPQKWGKKHTKKFKQGKSMSLKSIYKWGGGTPVVLQSANYRLLPGVCLCVLRLLPSSSSPLYSYPNNRLTGDTAHNGVIGHHWRQTHHGSSGHRHQRYQQNPTTHWAKMEENGPKILHYWAKTELIHCHGYMEVGQWRHCWLSYGTRIWLVYTMFLQSPKPKSIYL